LAAFASHISIASFADIIFYLRLTDSVENQAP